jgi:hypothetical protein
VSHKYPILYLQHAFAVAYQVEQEQQHTITRLLLCSQLSKASSEHAARVKELEEAAEAAEAERIFTELELNNARSESDAAVQRVKVLEEGHDRDAAVLQVPIASVSDVAPGDLSQQLKAAHKEV